MAPTLDKMISYAGMAASAFGMMFTVLLFITLNGAIDSMHRAGIEQADSGIAVLQDAGNIAQSTADSVDSLAVFASNVSLAMNESAGAIGTMGDAASTLADSLGSVPFMPGGATNALYAAAAEMGSSEAYMRQTAASMANVTGNAASTAAGVQQLKDDLDSNVASLQKMKKELDGIAGTMKLGLFLGCALVLLLFVLNGLMFYRQLRQ